MSSSMFFDTIEDGFVIRNIFIKICYSHNSIKEHTAANMYSTAENVSSNDANKLHSIKMVDALLQSNGYDKRVLAQIKQKRKNKISQPTKKKNGAKTSTLKIPFLSDNCTTRIKRAAEKFKLPIRVVTTPRIKLKNVLTSSKPLDKTTVPECRL